MPRRRSWLLGLGLAGGLAGLLLARPRPAPAADPVDALRPQTDRLIQALTTDPQPYARLAELCDRFGARMAGSPNIQQAADFVLATMKSDGLEGVRGEPVTVPRFRRDGESLELVLPRAQPMAVMALGGTVSTPKEGLAAELLVVRSFDELEARKLEAKGRIVVFVPEWKGYGETVIYRRRSASAAARHGAVAALVRSMAAHSIYSVHTGVMKYDDGIAQIPVASITSEDAEMFLRMARRGDKLTARLRLLIAPLPDATDRNIVAELRGRERPHEVVVIGGHFDSWDVGQGAHDDGGNCVAAWHAVLKMKQLGLRPRRTVRVVLWTAEELGGIGGDAYALAHEKEKHVFALEADSGLFRPLGFNASGGPAHVERTQRHASLLSSLGAFTVAAGHTGVDIEPLEKQGTPGLGLKVAGERYFWYHHTHGDTVDKVDPKDLGQVAATMAVMAYAAAELD